MDRCIVVSASNYSHSFPGYAQPQIVGEYSVDKTRNVIIGRKFLRYLNEKMLDEQDCRFDLSEGYSNFEKKDVLHNEKLDVFLKWIAINAQPKKKLKEVSLKFEYLPYRDRSVRMFLGF